VFVALQLLEELEFERENFIKVKLKNDETGLLAMLPVFKTCKQAKKIYPNSQIIELTEVNKC
jgi:hypothetical protein